MRGHYQPDVAEGLDDIRCLGDESRGDLHPIGTPVSARRTEVQEGADQQARKWLDGIAPP